tara:strand:+ start:4909 stop:6603 length:1695 start_codon:yes stop_codon:yes gene_type:complete
MDLKEKLKDAYKEIRTENFVKAENIYKDILKKSSNNFEANLNLGTLYARQSKFHEAVKYLEVAISQNSKVPQIYNNLGLIYTHLDKNEKAIEVFNKVIKLNSASSVTYCHLGIAYTNLSKVIEAEESYKKSLELDPKNVLSLYNYGTLFKRLNDPKNAEKYLTKAISISPNNFPPYNNLMEVYDKSNQNEKLKKLIDDAKSKFKNNTSINLFDAKLLFKLREYEKVIELLEKISFDGKEKYKEHNRTELIAKSYDHISNYKKAFEYFKITNEVNYDLNKDIVDKNKYIEVIEKRIKFFDKEKSIDWPVLSEINKNSDPTFLIGFPRSGTTLLDTILRSHPLIDVLEEKPIVDKFVELLNTKIKSDFKNLKDHKIDKEMRDFYFREKSNYSSKKNCKIVIDKMPLNTVYVGEIVRFFPNAKFIFAIRHPSDCVLSCFMQNFLLNNAMTNFLNLEDSAKLYNQVMILWELYNNKLKINFHMIRYEDLIENFETEVKKLLNYLGVDWSNKVTEFYKTSKKRGMLNTPSYNQVSQPLYTKSIGRWKNYQDQFQDISPILDKWIQKFSY